MLTPVEMPRFGGLNVSSDPQEESLLGAIDLLNVDLDYEGRLRTRNGYAQFATPTFSAGKAMTSLHRYADPTGAVRLLVAGSGGINTFNDLGTQVTASNVGNAIPAATKVFFVDGGTGTTEYVAIAWSGATAVRLLDTSSGTITVNVTMPSACSGPMGVTPWDARLVVATNRSRLLFSDPDSPSSFGPNNFLDVDPGDGEAIVAITAWGQYLFVFKQTKFYVFYGTSIDANGNPIFNYRPVRACDGAARFGSVVATREGVYYLNGRGLSLTTGSTSTNASGPLDALFDGQALPYMSSALQIVGTAAVTSGKVWATNRKVYVFSSSRGSLVYDRQFRTWTAANVPFDDMASLVTNAGSPVNGNDDLVFIANNVVYLADRTLSTDAGATISANYRTGFWNPGKPGADSTVREWLIDGNGTTTTKTTVNDAVALGAGAPVTLGIVAPVSQGRDRRATRGRNVSVEFSGAAPWSISRVIANVRGQSAPGLKHP